MREITLQQMMDKVCEALPDGSWTLRRQSAGVDEDHRWRVTTTMHEEDIQRSGRHPQDALMCFLMAVLECEQRHSAEQEKQAREARDREARVRRAVETL